MEKYIEMTEAALKKYLEIKDNPQKKIYEAMGYSLFAGGKRLRPVIMLMTTKMLGKNPEISLPFAVSLEMIHTYSLIHDDLPSMDNDDLRRGRPTNHKVFGEGIAILAGDALLTEAFAMLTKVPANERYVVGDYVAELAYRTGSLTLVGGQVLDLEGEGRSLSIDELRAIHNGKTTALILASVRLGALAAGASPEQLEALSTYGRCLGLAFQIIDDILDITSTPEVLGKSIGKDAAVQKATYPALVGMEAARAEARELTEAGRAALDIFPPERREALLCISDYLLNRDY